MGLVIQVAFGIMLGFVLLELLPYILVISAFATFTAVAGAIIVALGFWIGWSNVAVFLGAWSVVALATAAKGRLKNWIAAPRMAEKNRRFRARWQKEVAAADRAFGWVLLFCMWLYTAPFCGLIVFLLCEVIIVALSKLGILPPDADNFQKILFPVGAVSGVIGAAYAAFLTRKTIPARQAAAKYREEK